MTYSEFKRNLQESRRQLLHLMQAARRSSNRETQASRESNVFRIISDDDSSRIPPS